MSDHFEVMPDYLAALELELRARAVPVTAERRQPRRWRPPALATALAALVLMPLLFIAQSVRDEAPAYGAPAILAARPVPTPAFIRGGLVLKKAGWGADLATGRPFKAFGATAFLLNGEGVWCLSAPDPWARNPTLERGAACTHTREFMRVGIQVVLRHSYLAVIPQGVKSPTLIHADGTRQTLPPNQQGVVTVKAVAPGDRFVLHGLDGQRRTAHAR